MALTAEELLAGGSLTHEVAIPHDLLGNGSLMCGWFFVP